MPLEAQILTRDFRSGEDVYYNGQNYRIIQTGEHDEYHNLVWKSWFLDNMRYVELPHLLDLKTQKEQHGDGYFVNPVIDSIYFNHAGALKVCPAGWRIPRIGEWDTLLKTMSSLQREYMFGKLSGFIGYHSAVSDNDIIKERQLLKGGYWWAADTIGSRAYVIKITENNTYDIGVADVWDNASVRCVKDEE